MMSRLFLVLAVSTLWVGCGPRVVKSNYNTDAPIDVVRAWADAYNSDRIDQLGLLVHPQRQADFGTERATFRERLKVWRVDRYHLGEEVRVNDQMLGHRVTLFMHDGRRGAERAVVIVETKGRWWFWKYSP